MANHADAATELLGRMFPDGRRPLAGTDPEFVQFFSTFAFGEVPAALDLDDRTRALGWLSTLLGCGGVDDFRMMLPACLNLGLTPVEVKEIVYQANAYLGIGRVLPFLRATNEVFGELGIALPLEPQGTTTPETRCAAGEQAQVDIFGEHMRGFATSGDPRYPKVNEWLSANCFGDYYTRGGLDYQERELVTFCVIAAQGGCDPQLKAHAAGNLAVGNTAEQLFTLVQSNLPFIGYPRTLNAISAINAALPKDE